ncbi:MAG: MvaI/BcnI family restriction endonuclease [Candidatus Helarchaeota archaeon]|nr:MvaI/BcnI family restriction endonuclease [Candidatus Helarchaeota archaeon]
MQLQTLQKELKKLKEKGFLPSLRRGPTGIGYTLETYLDLKENNVAIPDIGGRVELKATRRRSSSLITLFTFNKGVWKIKQKTFIEKFGYNDESGRLAFYNLVKVGEVNTQGLTLTINQTNNTVSLINASDRELIAEWNIYNIVGKFLNKTERLLLVVADSRTTQEKKEEFHFNEAYLLQNPKPEFFLAAFNKGSVVIDIRMHLKPDNAVRNHGTGIRVRESDMALLYEKKQVLL